MISKLWIFGIVAVMTAGVAMASTSTIEVGNNGALRISSATSWGITHVVVTRKVLAYGDTWWKRAYLHPSTVVPIKVHAITMRDGLFHFRKTQIADIGVVYNTNAARVQIVYNVLRSSKVTFNMYSISWLVTLAFLLALLVMRVKNIRDSISDFSKINSIAFIAYFLLFFMLMLTCVTAASAAFPFLSLGTFLSTTAAIVPATILVGYDDVVSRDRRPLYIIGIYAVLMVTGLVFFLVS